MTDEPTSAPWNIRYTSVGNVTSLTELHATPKFQRLSSMVMTLMDEFAKLGVVMEIRVDRPDECAAWARMRAERLALSKNPPRIDFV